MNAHRRAGKHALPSRQIFPCLEILDERRSLGEALLSTLFGASLLDVDLFGSRSDHSPWPEGATDTRAILLVQPIPSEHVVVLVEDEGGTTTDQLSEVKSPVRADRASTAHRAGQYDSNPLENWLAFEDSLSSTGDPVGVLPGQSARVRAPLGAKSLSPNALLSRDVTASGEMIAAPVFRTTIGPNIPTQATALTNTHQPLAVGSVRSRTALHPMETLSTEVQGRIADTFEQMPLRFEENKGQFDARVDFAARATGSMVFLRPSEAVQTIDVSAAPQKTAAETTTLVLRMQVVGGNPDAAPIGLVRLPGITNYYRGSDPAHWREGIFSYAKVEYEGVYPGIDLVYYGRHQDLEYDFVVAAGADPGMIRLTFVGSEGQSIDEHGNLVLHTAAGDVVQSAPYMYQEVNGIHHRVAGHFVLTAGSSITGDMDGVVTFSVGAYDRAHPLVIDPYSTFLGGSSEDAGYSVGVDASGNAWVSGRTQSSNFPIEGSGDSDFEGSHDAFVAKLSLAGDGDADLVYSTFLGGEEYEYSEELAVDASGNAYVTGRTQGDFDRPITQASFQCCFGGGSSDAWVAKLNSSGGIAYASYLGGGLNDHGIGIAVDDGGQAYVTGVTGSTNFPLPTNCRCNAAGDDAFIIRLSAAGDAVNYCRYLGGGDQDIGEEIILDSSNNAYVVGRTFSTDFPMSTVTAAQTSNAGGRDVFVAKLDLSTPSNDLRYSTYLGGGATDEGYGIDVDASGIIYLTGLTGSSNFPTRSGAYQATHQNADTNFDVFVAKLDPTISGTGGLLYSTYLGGSGTWNGSGEATLERGRGIAVDASGCVSVYGLTNSSHNDASAFPIWPTTGSFFGSTGYSGGTNDAFVAKLNPNASGSASLIFSRYLGGSERELDGGLALASNADIVVTGSTYSPNFPTAGGVGGTPYSPTFFTGRDAFVTRFEEEDLPPCA